MMKFDWMNAWNKYMYFDTESSKVWAEVFCAYDAGRPPLYFYESDTYLDLDKLKKIIENKFSRYGSRINSVKDSV